LQKVEKMKILGIETSCDETAAAVVQDGTKILSNLIASQVDIHTRFGGIVPEVASRQHLLATIPIIQEAMAQAQAQWSDLDAIAVTIGPGLAGSLLVGVNIAKAIALAQGLPLLAVNHLEGHIYANWLEGRAPDFPSLCLIVSGGHTDLLLMRGHGDYLPLGRTRDDAAGEAFDKVARILGLGYPGGPAIEQAALDGDSTLHRLPRAWLKGTDDFSFSGLKTAVLRLVEEQSAKAPRLEETTPMSEDTPSKRETTVEKSEKADIAASFQEAVADVLVTKTVAAATRLDAHQVILCGGVASNHLLRQMMAQRSPLPVLIPSPILCTDNAAMIASCGYFHLKAGQISGWDLDVAPNLRLA
jgi:N6-L-threonylcarbamoyladenine synthase